MKILLIGSDQIWSLERVYYKYLQELHAEVDLFPAQNYFYEYYNSSLLHKIIYRAGLSRIIYKINNRLMEKILLQKPDVVWVFKGMEILPDTLKNIKSRGIFVVNYNPDNPFIFTGAGSGNANVTKSVSLYDFHFTYNLEIKKQLEALGCKAELLPFGFNLREDLYAQCCMQEEKLKTCFIGNPDKQRVRFIEQLTECGVEIDIYGHNWEKYIKNTKATLLAPAYGDEFWKILYRYRIQLNIMRLHNENSHNMRSFEIPAVGGIMLAPDTTEHRLFFNDTKEVFLYSDITNCVSQIKHILSLNKTESDEIRKAARERSLQSRYSYKERAAIALQYFEKSFRSYTNAH